MRRAVTVLAVILAMAAFAPVPARAVVQAVTSINGIGLLDYRARPDLKVGTWVKYHVTGQSALGLSDDYVVTVAVAGEERFWGDEGVWIETLTEPKGQPGAAVATLMSYAIFGDSLAFPHMQYYIRKTCSEIDEQGRPVQVVARRPPETLTDRSLKERDIHWHIDSLETDTVRVPRGLYVARRVEIRQGIGNSADQGDSTIYTEVRENRNSFVSPGVPITHIVREDIDYSIRRKKWLIGRSQDAPEIVMEHSTGSAELVDFGTGYKPSLVPAALAKSLAEQDRAAARAATPRKRPTPRKPG